jgi:histidinol-phosphate aminotransferase
MIEALIRPHIRALVPYSTARDEFTGTARVYLDANESPFASAVNRYPDPHQRAVKAKLSTLFDVPAERIFVGNGSDEAIDLLVRAIAAPEDAVTIMPPTYGMYKVAALTNAVRVLEAPLKDDFSPDMDAVRSAAACAAKILFVCSPNNPTGEQVPLDTIQELTEIFPGLIVIDEAYVDFTSGPSAARLIDSCDRIVVLRTLSKSWGLAGARLGLAIGHERLIAALSKIKAPYNVSTLTQQVVLEALSEPARQQEQVQYLLAERIRVAVELKALPQVLTVYRSDANFLLVKFNEASAVFEYLRRNGVIVRDRTRERHCTGCLRITIGTREENDTLLQLIKSFL